MEDRSINQQQSRPFQLFVKLLTSKTVTLNFTTPRVYGHAIKDRIFEITRIPPNDQRLIFAGYQLKDNSVISTPESTVHLVLRLLGGKGGFGSLLRGAATKAGQKKTNNFDACRDMSGRRLRHVNAEKRLEEWRAEEEGRKLEKMAEEFLKKKEKKGKKGVGDGEAEKYVAKYREESARCVAEIEESVKEACGNGKRKSKEVVVGGAEAKRLKIWMGKRKLGESDEDSSDDEDEENERSVVLNNGNHSDSSKEAEGSLDSVTGVKQDVGNGLCEGGSEEEKDTVMHQSLKSGGENVPNGEKRLVEHEIYYQKEVPGISVCCSVVAGVSVTEAVQTEKKECNRQESENIGETIDQLPNNLNSVNVGSAESGRSVNPEANGSSVSKPEVHEDMAAACVNTAELEKPLNFDEFDTAAEMEVLGMERLKSELQARGLKCGGTLQERAARLFLLKSTPLEKLPKKLLAKK